MAHQMKFSDMYKVCEWLVLNKVEVATQYADKLAESVEADLGTACTTSNMKACIKASGVKCLGWTTPRALREVMNTVPSPQEPDKRIAELKRDIRIMAYTLSTLAEQLDVTILYKDEIFEMSMEETELKGD